MCSPLCLSPSDAATAPKLQPFRDTSVEGVGHALLHMSCLLLCLCGVVHCVGMPVGWRLVQVFVLREEVWLACDL